MNPSPTPPAAEARARVRPRPVFCAIEAEHCDLVLADDARRGRFTNAGATLDLGRPPRWVGGHFPPDEEWRIELSKHYVGLDLAHAFAVTGEADHRDAWVDLVRSWVEQVPVDHDPTDVVGRRLQNWVYAWQAFEAADPGGLDEGFVATLLGSLAAQADHLEANLAPERNHRTLELYALLVVFLALPGLDPGGHRLRAAVAALAENLLRDVRTDGVHRERSTHYHLIALRSFVAARVNLARHGVALPDGYDARLRAACRFGLHVHRPDGDIPALSDSDGGSYLDLLALAGRALDDPELLWAGTRGAEGVAPVETAVSFPVGGYYVQRSAWRAPAAGGADERFLLLSCGPLGDGGHGHYDTLSVEAYGRGRPLVVDPGRYTYAEDAEGDGINWRHWFKGTAAHNTVTVDGLDQTPYRRGKPKGPTASAALLRRTQAPDLDVLVGEATSPAYDAVHRRHVAFVGGEYWVVVDELEAHREHAYALRWHLTPEAATACAVVPAGAGSAVLAPGLALLLPEGGVSLEEGWVSRRYGERRAAPVVRVDATGPVARFVTVLVPTTDLTPVPRVGLLRASSDLPSLTRWGTRGLPAAAVCVIGTGPQGSLTDVLTLGLDGAWNLRRSRTTEGC